MIRNKNLEVPDDWAEKCCLDQISLFSLSCSAKLSYWKASYQSAPPDGISSHLVSPAFRSLSAHRQHDPSGTFPNPLHLQHGLGRRDSEPRAHRHAAGGGRHSGPQQPGHTPDHGGVLLNFLSAPALPLSLSSSLFSLPGSTSFFAWFLLPLTFFPTFFLSAKAWDSFKGSLTEGNESMPFPH